MFEKVLAEAKQGFAVNDSGRVVIEHPSLNNSIVVPLRPLEQLDAETVMQIIEKTLTSHEELDITDGFNINVGIINQPKGSGRLRITKLHGENNSLHRKQAIINIVNVDHMCMARAIAMSWAKLHTVTAEEWQTTAPKGCDVTHMLRHQMVPKYHYSNMLSKTRHEQETFARTLCRLTGVSTERPASLNDIPAFEDVLDVNILVISAKLGNKFVRITDNTHRKNVYLYLVNDHYHAIANISGFFLSHYFCESCLQPYDHNHRHFCATTCIVCKRDGCLETDTPLSCRRCHMTCRSLECFNRHKQNTVSKGKNRRRSPSQCDTWWKCTTCRKTLHVEDRTPEDHLCGEYKCQSCGRYVLNDHQCYVRATPTEEEHIPKFIFFDLECTQDDVLQCEE